MNNGEVGSAPDLAYKIAKLVEEKGWNQEDFARISKLNRHTVREIILGRSRRRLRNATVSQCAEALGLTVNELRNLPIERLLPRMHGEPPSNEEALKLLYDQAALPELVSWLRRHETRACLLTPEEIRELLELQQPGGALERLGVEHVVEMIERRRALLAKVRQIAGTEYLDFMEQFVDLLCDKLQHQGKV